MFKDQNEVLLETLRKQLREVDEELVRVIAERAALTQKIGKLKKQMTLPAEQPAIFQLNLQHLLELGKSLELNVNQLEKIYSEVHQYSVKMQEEILNEPS